MTIDHEDLIAEARDYLDRECNVSQWPNLVSRLADALESTTARLREAEAVIGQALTAWTDDSVSNTVAGVRAYGHLSRYKPTTENGSER